MVRHLAARRAGNLLTITEMETAMHLHVGTNVPGFLPETDPICAHDVADAFTLLHSEITYTLDNITDDGAFLALDTKRNTITESDVAAGVEFHAGGYVHWVATVAGPASECELSRVNSH